MGLVVLPVVHEVGLKRGGAVIPRTVVDDFPCQVREIDRGDITALAVERPGMPGLRYFRYGGTLWCPLTGPAGGDTAADEAAGVLRAAWAAAPRRSVTGKGWSVQPIDLLRVGQRSDGSFYPHVPPRAGPVPETRSMVRDDIDHRRAAASDAARKHVVLLQGCVWRSCAVPLFIVKTNQQGSDPAVGMRYVFDGFPRGGAAAAWSIDRLKDIEHFKYRLRHMASVGLIEDDGVPADIPALAALVDGLCDHAALNVGAIAALLRDRLGEYVPWMSHAALRLRADLLEAEESLAAFGAGWSGAFYGALEAFASSPYIGDDSQSASARQRWGRTVTDMEIACARYRIEDLGLPPAKRSG